MASAMRPSPIVVLFLTLLVAGAARPEASEVTLQGSYEWNMGSRGSLAVTFMPDDADGWEVSFRFDHSGQFHTYEGTAVGELGRGALEGRVDSGRGTRYRFRGAFEAGVFTGKHYTVSRSGRQQQTGTLTFELAPSAEGE